MEILHSVQDGQVRIYSHFHEVEAILWAMGVFDGENGLDAVITMAEVGSGVMGQVSGFRTVGHR